MATSEPRRVVVQPAAPIRTIQGADNTLRPAAFEEEGPQLGTSGEGEARVRSVIVNRETPPPAVRWSQLPPSEPAAGAGSQFDDDLGLPPTGIPELPLEETPIEPPPLEQAPLEQAPLEQQPLPTGPTAQPPAAQPLQTQPFVPPAREPVGQLPLQVPQPSEATVEAERKRSSDACEQGLADLQQKTIDKLDLTIAVTGEEGSDYPFECTLEDALHRGRCWDQTVYMWKASALCHKPLYFEDEQLERYGHSWPPCFQPFVSGAHFFCTLPVLPYCMGVEPPMECVYALGHYRPGSCAPYILCDPVPLSCRGALFQAGAVVGTAAVLP